MGQPPAIQLLPDWESIRVLGEGEFGKVWLVRDNALGVDRALKCVEATSIYDPTDFYREPQTLQELHHEGIVSVAGAGSLGSGGIYILMEYLPRGSAQDLIENGLVPMRQATGLIRDVCWALEFAHTKGFVHRDVKPGNILISNTGRGKLSDFGLTTRAPRGGAASPAGYLMHITPEVISQGISDPLTDVYALGVTLYRMINGDSYLPRVSDGGELEGMILDGKYPNRKAYRLFVSSRIKAVVNRAMNADRSSRYSSASEFRVALEQLTIECDWVEETSPASVRWTGSAGDRTVEAQLESRSNGYAFTVRRTTSGGKPRRIVADCVSRMTKSEGLRHARKVLARITATGK